MTLSFAPERIECWPLERLKPYAQNAKTHGADQVAKIAASMAQFGWTVPVLVAGDGEVIAGHGRILAATHLGLTDAPVIVLDHLSEAQRRAYRLADNKLTELGAWDEALLAGELQELLADDFDLSVVGFSDAELDALLAGEGDAGGGNEGEDEVPETPVDPVSRPGDLWLLGPHRLLCGDATVITDLDRLMAGRKADLCFTDSPYNVDYAGGVGAEEDVGMAAALHLDGIAKNFGKPPGSAALLTTEQFVGVPDPHSLQRPERDADRVRQRITLFEESDRGHKVQERAGRQALQQDLMHLERIADPGSHGLLATEQVNGATDIGFELTPVHDRTPLRHMSRNIRHMTQRGKMQRQRALGAD